MDGDGAEAEVAERDAEVAARVAGAHKDDGARAGELVEHKHGVRVLELLRAEDVLLSQRLHSGVLGGDLHLQRSRGVVRLGWRDRRLVRRMIRVK